MSERTALYRFYDAEDALLYVGVTKSPKTRLKDHARDKWWWAQVARQEITWYDSRFVAEEVEAEIIKAWKPVHNSCFQVGRLPDPAKSHLLPADEILSWAKDTGRLKQPAGE